MDMDIGAGCSSRDPDLHWNLEKYARYLDISNITGRPKSQGKGKQDNPSPKWKLYEGGKEALVLTVTRSHHLIITHGKEIQENHSMWNAQQWMKGISKEDSLLIIYKIQDVTRQFRVKFAASRDKSGVDQCNACVHTLSKYFIFKQLGDQQVDTQKSSSQEGGDQSQSKGFSGPTAIKKLAQVLTGELQENLPKAYQSTNIPTDPTALQTLVQLCLTDTNFPAFVGAVDQALSKVIKDTEE